MFLREIYRGNDMREDASLYQYLLRMSVGEQEMKTLVAKCEVAGKHNI